LTKPGAHPDISRKGLNMETFWAGPFAGKIVEIIGFTQKIYPNMLYGKKEGGTSCLRLFARYCYLSSYGLTRFKWCNGKEKETLLPIQGSPFFDWSHLTLHFPLSKNISYDEIGATMNRQHDMVIVVVGLIGLRVSVECLPPLFLIFYHDRRFWIGSR
jgi:hypothetical protein